MEVVEREEMGAPEWELPEDFYLEFEKSLEKSRLYAERHKSNLKKAVC